MPEEKVRLEASVLLWCVLAQHQNGLLCRPTHQIVLLCVVPRAENIVSK